jgi:hypothetical protein
MTRRYTDQLLQELPNELPDNTGGDITPAVLRQMVTDIVQSLRPAFAAMEGNHQAAPVQVTLNNSTWTPLVTGIYTAGMASDSAELAYNMTTGSLVTKFSDFIHFFTSELSFEGPNGRNLDLSIGVNGAAVGMIGAIECLGNNILQQFNSRVVAVPPQNAQIQLLAKWYGGQATDVLKVSQIQLLGEIITTRYP